MSQIITTQDAIAIAIIGGFLISFITFTLRYLNSDTKPYYTNLLKILFFPFLIFWKNDNKIRLLSELNIKVKNQKKEISSIKNELLELNEADKLKQRTISRLNKYIVTVERKANFNLTYGLFFCIVGISFIFYSMSIYTPTADETLQNSLIYFIPRITLTLLIEVFSYFFLNLYKRNLEDIKYFQNEVTNLESKYLAILYAFENNNGQVKAKVIENLMETERNFILRKDETTIELEKNRIDAQSSNSTVQALKDIINFKR